MTTPLSGPSEKALLGCSERLVNVKKAEVTGVTSDGKGALGFRYGFWSSELLMGLVAKVPEKMMPRLLSYARCRVSGGQFGDFTKKRVLFAMKKEVLGGKGEKGPLEVRKGCRDSYQR